MIYSPIRSPIAQAVRGGLDFARVRDPVLSAGGIYLLDDRSRYVRPGLAFARAQQVYGVQGDGSYVPYTGSQVPWEAQGVRLDPGWTQNCLWSDEITAARGWNLSFITPEVNAGGINPPHPGGSYTRLTVNSAGLALIYRTATVTPGASQTLSFMVRLGTLAASDLKFGIYNETALSWIAVDQVPAVTPTAGGWTRCDVSVTIPAGCTTIRLYPFRNNLAAAGATFYLAAVNGTTTAYPVPLTVATGSAITVPAFSFSGLLADMGVALGSEYTLGMEYEVISRTPSQFPPVAQLRVGTTGGSNITTGFFIHPNGSQFAIARNTADIYLQQSGAAGLTRSVLRIKDSAFRAASNGVLATAGASGAQPPGLTAIQIGRDGAGAVCAAMYVKKLWLIPSLGLSDAQLQALSATA